MTGRLMTAPEVASLLNVPLHAVRRLKAVEDVPRAGLTRLIDVKLLPKIAAELTEQGYLEPAEVTA